MLQGFFLFQEQVYGQYILILCTMNANATDKPMGITIHGSTNDFSSETTIGTAYTSLHYSSINSNAQYVNGSCNVLFNCSDITTHKVRFKTNSVDTAGSPSSIDVTGVAGNIHTGVLFQRVGDAQ